MLHIDVERHAIANIVLFFEKIGLFFDDLNLLLKIKLTIVSTPSLFLERRNATDPMWTVLLRAAARKLRARQIFLPATIMVGTLLIKFYAGPWTFGITTDSQQRLSHQIIE